LEEFATTLQTRKYEFLLDAAWLRDPGNEYAESAEPVMRSELDLEAYELVRGLSRVFVPGK